MTTAKFVLRSLSACVLAGSSLFASAQTQLKLASVYPDDSFHVQNLRRFAEDVDKATAGKLRIDVHSNASLMKAAEIFPAVREGKVEAGEVIMSSLSKDIPLFAIDTLPFIVSGYGDAKAMWEASRDASQNAMDRHGVTLLYTVPWQPQNLYSVRKIEKADDFKGLRLRHYSPTTERIAQMLGATPVVIPVQMDEMTKAIAGGQLDLMLTSSWTGVQTKSWSKMPYYYKVSAWIPKNVVFVNKAKFDSLPSDQKAAVLRAAQMAEVRGWALSQSLDEKLEAELAANRTTVTRLEPVVLRFFDRVGEQISKDWIKQAPPNDVRVLTTYMIRRSTK